MKRFPIEKFLRPECAGFEPYAAGKPVETIKRELGLRRVVKLASNENPMGPSPRALSAMKKALEKLYFYPDSNSYTLRQTIAADSGTTAQNIMLGAGSDELIALIGMAFLQPEDEVVISEHAFVRYQMAARLMGARIVRAPMKGFTHDLEAMAAAVTSRTKIVFIANPNNPTGTYVTAVELRRFFKAMLARRRGTPPLVVMDEAYYEYAALHRDYPRTVPLLSKYPGLIILRTFSKIYALAGLRVGYGFASREVVDYIDRIRPPFNINSLAQAAAAASLGDKEQVKKGVALTKEGKRWVGSELSRMGLPFVPSATNFLLFDVSPRLGMDVFKELLRKGVIVRPMGEYDYPHHVRVTIGLPQENQLFIRSLKQIIARK